MHRISGSLGVILMAAAVTREALAAERLCGAGSGSETLVDFRERGAEVAALGAEVTTEGGVGVRFPTPGSGVRLSAPSGKWNAYRYVAIAVDVTNPGTGAVSLIGCLNGRAWNTGFLHVPPGQSATMLLYLLRKNTMLQDRRKDQFTGMRGIPGGHLSHWDCLDPRTLKTISIRDLDGASVGQGIVITAVRGVGTYGALPKEMEATYFPFVDPFGQFMHEDWPGKVASVADLRSRTAAETGELSMHPGPESRSLYGGWTGGPRLTATGHFRTEKHAGTWWLVDPEGCLFWSHGITGVHTHARTQVGERTHYFETIPETYGNEWHIDFAKANLVAKHGPDWEQIAGDIAHRRLRSWGMNTIGNWSEPTIYTMQRTPYTVAIHYAGYGKDALPELLKTPDEFRMLVRTRLERERGVTSTDPWCIGYFVDNEIRWQRGMDADLYYRIISEEVRRVAPDKLYLGSRLHGHAHPHGSKAHIVAAAARYCDVLSINRYRFSPSDLIMVEGADLPIIIGEFHFGALDRGMIHTGLRGVANQRQRAFAYEHYVTRALTHPHIVGTHWFQFREQNITGRGDGENYQIGFVDICDTPYTEIVAAARRIGRTMYETRASR